MTLIFDPARDSQEPLSGGDELPMIVNFESARGVRLSNYTVFFMVFELDFEHKFTEITMKNYIRNSNGINIQEMQI